MATSGSTSAASVAAGGSSLTLNAAELTDRIESYMGWSSPTAANQAWALARLNDGYRRFLKGEYLDERGAPQIHSWGFLRPTATVALWVDEAGTMAVTSTTTVDVTSATMYASMVGHTITSTNGSYVIQSYTDSDTVVVATDASADNGEAFTMTATGSYRMVAAFGGILEDPVIVNDDYGMVDMQKVSPGEIARLRRDSTADGDPEYFAVVPVASGAVTGQLYNLEVYPVPTETRTVTLRFRALPNPLTDGSGVYPAGGADHCDTILALARAAAELESGKTQGVMEEAALKAMRSSVDMDRTHYDTTDVQDMLVGEEPF